MKEKLNPPETEKPFERFYNLPVCLVWFDVRSHSNWMNDPLSLEPITCTTYGILLGINEKGDCIVIASTKAHEEDLPPWSDVNIIPLSLIKGITLLEEKS